MASTNRKRYPSDDESNRRVEVTVTVDKTGERQVVLQDLSFGNGIGWYTEKSIRLDSKQVEALLRRLCACRQHPSTRPDPSSWPAADEAHGRDAAEGAGEATILTFPTILPSS